MRKKRKIIRLNLIFFSVILITLSVAYSILKEDLKITGTVNIENKLENGEITVTYMIKNSWNSNGKYYHLIEMNLHNGTDKALNGWKISIKSPANAKLENYFGTEATIDENNIHFKHTSYNSSVESKGKVTFEFQISTTDANYKPSDIVINDTIPDVPDIPEDGIKKVDITYVQEQAWKSENRNYYQYVITVKNTGTLPISSWNFNISLKGNSKIEQIWNANYVQDNKRFTISNTSYNGNIDVGKEVSFGMIISSNMNHLDLDVTNITVN